MKEGKPSIRHGKLKLLQNVLLLCQKVEVKKSANELHLNTKTFKSLSASASSGGSETTTVYTLNSDGEKDLCFRRRNIEYRSPKAGWTIPITPSG
ncbi:hypothetical protein CEXT_97191 [Caerostris extrusa]|uniref:Uncharacterized protein n=1 Tax=Caerostris extrusa TaxID=172846 RepID=A0AAV4NEI9_CAEEX|nr:hypothetical protein CEXT_97191 [Caerostris extrusa]